MPRTNAANPFYNLLQQDTGHRIFAGDRLQLKSSPTYGSFALITLPNKRQELRIANRTHVVDEHHMSIYEVIRPDKASSFYHYTVTLERGVYKLHIYFDNQDKPCYLTLLDTSPKAIPIPPEDKELLIQWAIMQCAPDMSVLRMTQETIIQSTQESLIKKIDLLLKINLPIDHGTRDHPIDIDQKQKDKISAIFKELLARIEEALVEANYLASIGGSETQKQLLEKYQEFVSWEYADWLREQHTVEIISPSALDIAVAETVSSSLALEEEDTKSHATLSSNAGGSSSISPDQAAKLRNLEESLSTLRTWRAHFDSMNPPSCDVVATGYQQAQETLLYLSECSPSLNPLNAEDFFLVHRSLQETEVVGIQLLIEAIMRDSYFDQKTRQHFDLLLIKTRDQQKEADIQTLSVFAKHMPNRVLKYLIEYDEGKTLELLLNTGAFPVNRYRIETEFGEHLSFLKFAFRRRSMGCFKIILEKGASTLELDMDDLPFAHTLWMLGPQDFFYKIFRDFYLAKGGLRSLLQQLMAIILKRAAELEDETPQKTALNQAIACYMSSLQSITPLTRGEHQPLARYLDRAMAKMEEEAGSQPVKPLSQDVQSLVDSLRSQTRTLQDTILTRKHRSLETLRTKLTMFAHDLEKMLSHAYSEIENFPEKEELFDLMSSVNKLLNRTLEVASQKKITEKQANQLNREYNALALKFHKANHKANKTKKENATYSSRLEELLNQTRKVVDDLEKSRIICGILSSVTFPEDRRGAMAETAEVSSEDRAAASEEAAEVPSENEISRPKPTVEETAEVPSEDESPSPRPTM